MLFAIAFIVVLGTIAMLMMDFSVTSLKETSDEYLRVEEKLKAKSATEYAVMALQARDFKNDGCINKIDINGTIFDVNITFHYFLTECPQDCNCSVISTQDSNGSVLINTYVSSKIMPHIRYFRQTLQKP